MDVSQLDSGGVRIIRGWVENEGRALPSQAFQEVQFTGGAKP